MSVTTRRARTLIVVAHPDDEAFLFGGAMLAERGGFDVLVVTDGRGTSSPAARARRLRRSADAFGFGLLEGLGFPDVYERRLDLEELVRQLENLRREYQRVWTHGLPGDHQSHPHHQDVAFACALAFPKRVEYCGIGFPAGSHALPPGIFRRKYALLNRCYPAEVRSLECDFQRFTLEGRIRLPDLREMAQIYLHVSRNTDAVAVLRNRLRIDDPWRLRPVRAAREPWLRNVIAASAGQLGGVVSLFGEGTERLARIVREMADHVDIRPADSEPQPSGAAAKTAIVFDPVGAHRGLRLKLKRRYRVLYVGVVRGRYPVVPPAPEIVEHLPSGFPFRHPAWHASFIGRI